MAVASREPFIQALQPERRESSARAISPVPKPTSRRDWPAAARHARARACKACRTPAPPP
eukprot:2860249-Pyramimonas_sp.AAC.1